MQNNPYPGTREFESSQSADFFGRGEEIGILSGLVQARRASLLFAQSGAGKSSLINAGLIPELTHGEEIGRGRRRRTIQKMFVLVAGVGGGIPSRLGRQLDNVFAFSTLHALSPDADPDELADQRLADGITPFIAEAGGGDEVPVLLVFDQFEELFTHHVERWRERLGFFEQVAAALEDHPRLHVLFSMREDFIAELTPFASLLPGQLRDHFRLERPRRPAAIEAVRRPAERGGCPFGEGVAEELVDNLRRTQVGRRDRGAAAGDSEPRLAEVVEPVHLQIVCRQLWDNLDSSRTSITARDVQQLGDVDEALCGFYEQGLERVLGRSAVREHRLRDWFEKTTLITPARTRGLVYRGEEKTEGLANQAVDLLVDAYLIRSTQRGGDTWYELAHDRLVEPILQANREWRARYLKPVTVAAEAWDEAERDPRKLYSGSHLAEAWATAEAGRDQHSALEIEFLEASQAAERQAVRRRRRQLYAAFGIAAVLAVAALIAVWQYFRAAEEGAAAQSRQLALASILVTSESHELSALLAIEAVRARATREAERALRDVLLRRGRTLYLLEGHSKQVRFAAWSPDLDQRFLITGGRDGTIRLWDAHQPRRPRILRGHTAGVVGVDWAGGRRLVSASYDGTARIWDAIEGRLSIVLEGHDSAVYTARWDRDGQRIATASLDGSVRIWAAGNGRELVRLNAASDSGEHRDAHKGGAYQASWSPDGRRLLSTGKDGTARLWDGRSYRLLTVLEGHDDAVVAAEWHPDGKLIVTASIDRTARLWDAGDGHQLARLDHSAKLSQARWSPGGERLVTAGQDGTLRLWDVVARAGQVNVDPTVLAGHRGAVHHVAWEGSGERLVSAGEDRTARLWDAGSGRQLALLAGHHDGVRHAAWNRTGDRVITASEDGSVRVWNIEIGHEEALFHATAGIPSVAWDPEDRRLATASFDRTAHVFHLDGETPPVELKGHEAAVLAIAWHPGGRRLATASRDGTVRIWDTATGLTDHRLVGHGSSVVSIAWDPRGGRLASASLDGSARLWTASGRHMFTFEEHGDWVSGVAWSPAGDRLLSAGYDGKVRLWDPANGRRIAIFEGHESAVLAAAWSADGKRIASTGADRSIRVWKDSAPAAESRQALREMWGHRGWVWHLAWSPVPGDQRVVSVSADGTARIWDATTGRQLYSLSGHAGAVRHAAWDPSGRWLVTASEGGTARVWDADGGEERTVLEGHSGRVSWAVWSGSGEHIATAGFDGSVRLFGLRLDHLASLACARMVRNMKREEWRRFIDRRYRETCPEVEDARLAVTGRAIDGDRP